MRLRLRLLLLLLSSFLRAPVRELDESVLSLWVLPNDIDISKITTDRYVSLMELGRMDYAFRVGLLRIMIGRNWVPLTTFCTIRFRHPLRVFQKYTLRTRVAAWDDRTFYFQHDFERGGRIVATGYVCSTLLSPTGPVSPRHVLDEIGVSLTIPERPEVVARLMELEELIHQGQHDEDPFAYSR